MKRTMIFGTLLAMTLGLAPSAMAKGPGRGDGDGAEAPVHERYREVRSQALRSQAGLDEATAVRVERVLDQFDGQRRTLRKETRERRQALRELLKSGSKDQRAYQQALDGLRATEKSTSELRQRELDALARELNPEQQARVLVTLMEMRHKAKRMYREHGGPHGRDDHGGPADRQGRPSHDDDDR